MKESTIRNKVYSRLKYQIITQELKMGEQLNIAELAKEFQCSTTPIREALVMLDKETLIVLKYHTEPQVIDITNKIFRSTFDAALVLLLGSYDFCIVQNRIPTLIELVETQIQYQEKIIETACDYEFVLATLSVDEAMIAASGNNYLNSLFSKTLGLQTLICSYDYKVNNVDRNANIKEHRIILDAIKSNSHDIARDLLHQHYARSIIFNDLSKY